MPTSYPAEFYSKESDLDKDENEDEDAHGGDTCNEDRELDDNDDNGSDSEDETQGMTNPKTPDMSTHQLKLHITAQQSALGNPPIHWQLLIRSSIQSPIIPQLQLALVHAYRQSL
jgi:hypothetical protein